VNRNHPGRAFALLATGILALAAFAACGDDGADADAADQSADMGTVVNAVIALDRAGLHEIDESIREGKVPPTAHFTALQLQTLVLLTPWPEHLRPQAETLAGLLGDMAAAVDNEPVVLPEAQEASRKAHVAHHEFSVLVWEELYREAGITADAEGHSN